MREARNLSHAVSAAALALLLTTHSPVGADVVTLNSGGTVHGNLLTPATGTSKSVAMLTNNGALIVFDRDGVQQVKRGADPAQKTPAAKSGAKKHLTDAEQAWVPKVRKLLARLASGDRDHVRQARTDLLNIDDPDAIPALTQNLRSNPDESLRRLYVAILHNIRGPKPIYFLVDQSLVDPSAEVRGEARKAIGEQRADMARPLYIHALRLRHGEVASRAALALAEIGDPRGESVPYLIDALVATERQSVLTQRGHTDVVDYLTIYATPGLDPRSVNAMYSNEISMGQVGGSSTMPVYLGPPGMSAAAQANAIRKLEQRPVSKSAPRGAAPQLRGPGTYFITPAVANEFAIPILGSTSDVYKRQHVRVENPIVLDVLVKLTDRKHPGYGYNTDNWHRWWQTERKDRDLQKPRTPDRPVPKAAASAP